MENQVVKFEPNIPQILTFDLTKKIYMTQSKFPIRYKAKDGTTKQFNPMQTVYTMTDGKKLYANTFLSQQITEAILETNAPQGAPTATLKITKTGQMSFTRYKVENIPEGN